MNRYLDLSIKELHELLLEKKITPLDLVEETYSRIEENSDLNSFITLNKTEATTYAEKLGSEEVATNLAFTGTIKDDILEKTEIAFSLLKYLVKNYKQNLSERYKLDNKIDEIMNQSDDIDENDKYLEIFELIGTKRGAIISGGRVDYEKVSGILLDEFRSGKLGKITLEKVKI